MANGGIGSPEATGSLAAVPEIRGGDRTPTITGSLKVVEAVGVPEELSVTVI